MHFFYAGHQKKYFTLPGCSDTEESRGLFDLRQQAAVGQLASVTKVLTDSGRALPVLEDYFFQRPSSDEHDYEDDQDASESDDGKNSDEPTDVARQAVRHAYGDDGRNASEEYDD